MSASYLAVALLLAATSQLAAEQCLYATVPAISTSLDYFEWQRNTITFIEGPSNTDVCNTKLSSSSRYVVRRLETTEETPTDAPTAANSLCYQKINPDSVIFQPDIAECTANNGLRGFDPNNMLNCLSTSDSSNQNCNLNFNSTWGNNGWYQVVVSTYVNAQSLNIWTGAFLIQHTVGAQILEFRSEQADKPLIPLLDEVPAYRIDLNLPSEANNDFRWDVVASLAVPPGFDNTSAEWRLKVNASKESPRDVFETVKLLRVRRGDDTSAALKRKTIPPGSHPSAAAFKLSATVPYKTLVDLVGPARCAPILSFDARTNPSGTTPANLLMQIVVNLMYEQKPTTRKDGCMLFCEGEMCPTSTSRAWYRSTTLLVGETGKNLTVSNCQADKADYYCTLGKQRSDNISFDVPGIRKIVPEAGATNEDSFPGWGIAVIVVGSVLLIAIIIVLIVIYCKRREKEVDDIHISQHPKMTTNGVNARDDNDASASTPYQTQQAPFPYNSGGEMKSYDSPQFNTPPVGGTNPRMSDTSAYGLSLDNTPGSRQPIQTSLTNIDNQAYYSNPPAQNLYSQVNWNRTLS